MLLILSVVVLGFASFLKRKLCAFARHDDHAPNHYFAALRPPDNGFDPDYDQHEHTFHFLVDGERPAWL
jgi:hypothetical protein